MKIVKYKNRRPLKLFNWKITLFLFASIFFTAACSQKNPQIEIQTELGNISVELFVKKAPITANNFLKYVKNKRLKDATFYRVVTMRNQEKDSIKIEVIQGGLYEDKHPDSYSPIEHETTEQTGILHKEGIISMARYTPGTATDDFFICVSDQPSLDFGGGRNPDKHGFAAFGKVIDGMDVVRKIHAQPEKGQYLDPQIKILDVVLKK